MFKAQLVVLHSKTYIEDFGNIKVRLPSDFSQYPINLKDIILH